jgi:uncharacterized protein (DUF433 family)
VVDPREVPAYGIPEVAHYLGIPVSTLRSWTVGQRYVSRRGPGFFKPLIRLADPERRLLSFVNLIEVHVLDAIRREHQISLQKVRKALDTLARILPSQHPLADHRFETDNLHLFVEKYGSLMSITQEGQLAMKKILQAHLRRIHRDQEGRATRLFLFTRRRDPDDPFSVLVDPTISFGRPVLAGTGIPTRVITERYKAGESIDELARDYERQRSEIEEAIRCELEAA